MRPIRIWNINANNGMNDAGLSEALGLLDVEIMDVTKRVPVKKISVCVPNAECNRVRVAMTDAGAGNISDEYSRPSLYEAQQQDASRRSKANLYRPRSMNLAVQEKKIESIVEDKDWQ